jgi:hypothetical protein
MQPTEEEKARAHRAQVILYLVMGVFILLPLVVYWVRQRR